ncbi:MAG TPA: putative aminohydrolase SsnA [Anaerolineales bacterium]|nr:putative aminohydrolase SsnA [Anaerolineales bacterium]
MIIHNVRIVTWGESQQLLTGQAVRINAGLIEAAGGERELLAGYPEDERLDGRGQILMPGNICAHTHFYGAFARGMAIPGRPPKDFPEILRKLWWPLDKALTPEDVRYSALVCLADAVRHGTTTLIDHHASPNAIEGSLDVLAEAVEASGLRAVLCYEVTDRDGPARAEAGIAENVRFLKRCANGGVAGGRVAANFGLHASLTLSDATLDACRNAAPEGAGFHIHVAEHEADEYDSLAKSGKRVVDRLKAHGILGQRTICAHCVHVDAGEAFVLRDTHSWVSHQPRSNMNNGVGAADVESLRRAGVRVCLGNDGFSNAMWEEWKAAYLVQKLWRRDPRRMPGGDLVDIAVNQNAALAGVFFPGWKLGVVEPGAAADLILVDYSPTTPLTAGNLPWHIVFGFHESMVTMTMVDGKILMQDRRLLTLDVEAITARSRELAAKVWERYASFVPADGAV